jgi:hypothetical protein
MANTIQIAPIAIRRIASPRCTFLVFAPKSIFGSPSGDSIPDYTL